MFTAAVRRCPASLSRNLLRGGYSSQTLRASTSSLRSVVARIPTQAPKVTIAAFHQSANWRQRAATQTAEESNSLSENAVTKFDELKTRGLVHPNVVDTITKKMKIHTMTEVQARTINEALNGVDVVAQARTGTGKTLGFLVPVIQKMITEDPQLGERTRRVKRTRPDDIRGIIISPTRELAEQIAVEAQKLCANTGVIVQVAVGGTQKRAMLSKTLREGCHLLIGTPGRLCDILSDEYSGIKAPKLNSFVLDEADRLMDDGFTEEINEIKKYLPDPAEQDRQTLMFSATLSPEVVTLVRRTLKPNFHFAQCIDVNEAPTHERVPQKMVHVNGFENIMPTLYELVTKAIQTSDRPFKAIIYFNSTAEVTLAASVFFKLKGRPSLSRAANNSPLNRVEIYEIHSKLSQAQRSRAADNFRLGKSAILFSSDVTARGMDFPDVTHVIQVGMPKDRDSYIHRIGRTGRAGKEGQGWLLLPPPEKHEIHRRLHKLPVAQDTSLEAAMVDMTQETEMPDEVANIIQKVSETYKKVYPDQLDSAYRGMFGSYQWYPNKRELIQMAENWAKFGWGMETAPSPPAFVRMGGRPGGGRPTGGFGGRGGGFGGRGGGGRSSFGDRSGGFRDRDSGFGGRSSGGFRDRDSGFGGRSGGGSRGRDSAFGDRRTGGYGDRTGGGFGDRPPRGDRPSYSRGDRTERTPRFA